MKSDYIYKREDGNGYGGMINRIGSKCHLSN